MLADSQGCIVPILEAHVKRHRIIPTNLCGSVLTTAVQFEYSKRETGVKLNALQAKSMKESLCFGKRSVIPLEVSHT